MSKRCTNCGHAIAKQRPWTTKERSIVANSNKTAQELSVDLNRSVASIYCLSKRAGIKLKRKKNKTKLAKDNNNDNS